MCGIVGIHGPQEEAWIGAMNEAIRHRGPDGEGVWRDRDALLALGMRRLAIIDIPGGRQPMATADGRFVLVFNGEIYNAPALRQKLEERGERFATDHSDTEVLLRLLVREGAAALPKLNGMFAFALYDRAEGRLFCARDRLGIKPFYWTNQEGRFAFASELKALLALPFVAKTLCKESLFHFLSLMYVPGERTIIDGVERLPAGHHLTYRLADGHVAIERWWAPSFTPAPDVAAEEWPALVREKLAAAVRRWSMSDVPIACSLSGGLDSSSVVGFLAESGVKVRTYSLGFTGEGEADWNELPLAREVASRWRTDHHELVLDPETLLEDLDAMVWALDEPYAGGLPSWSVFKTMARDVKVGLTGTGGDELFGNYGKWRALEPGLFRRKTRDAAAFRTRFFERVYYFSDADKRALLEGVDKVEDTAAMLWRLYRSAPSDEPRDAVAWTDLATQLPEEFLMMTDRFSMAHGLEARTPFLDHELVELAYSIPASLRTRRGDLKYLLRKAVAPVLPRPLLNAPKKGFVIPLKLWFRGRLRPLVEHLLAPERLARQGIIRPEFYAKWVRPHLEGSADHTNKVFAALMFQLWHRRFIEGVPAVDA